MTVTRLEIRAREPYEGGVEFGQARAYERIDGILHFAVDPALAANRSIVDLDKAERDSDGRVDFLADFCLLQPLDPVRGNRNLLYSVVNRGRRAIPGNRATASLVPTERIDPGDGFMLRRGWTLAWSGWQWDVARSAALMGLEPPQALAADGRPVQGQVMIQFQPNESLRDHLLADRMHRPYPAAGLDEAAATLFVRDWLDGPATEISRARWRFAHDEHGKPVADDTHIWLEGGFEAGRYYQVIYRTRICPIVGSGLLAVRDAISFLRYATPETGNPCAGRIEHTFGTGGSQSGRFLRNFLYLGLNVDEAGRQVFDGLLPTVAGAHRGEFNHRYAQPSVQATRGFGQLPPFGSDPQNDPLTGERHEGLLARQRASGCVPRIIYTNTAAEYWPGDASRGDASLLHTDLAGEHDLEPPAEERIYYFAGTQHGPGSLPLRREGVDGTRSAHDLNVVDFSPLVRAALINLELWVVTGEEPPRSAFPRLDDGTAVPIEAVIQAFRAIPGASVPAASLLPASRRLDLGPEATHGIGRYPAQVGESYPRYVSAVDSDGNELAGIRLPDVAVPVATYTGWNPRDPETGGAGQLIMMWGSTLPFAATEAERRQTGDPRPSIAERYRDRDDYLARVRAAAEALAAERYLLDEDIELVVRLAGERYDAFARPLVGARREA